MDKRVQQLKILNEIYVSMKHNFDTLKKIFNKENGIKQKIILTEQMLQQVYMSILQKLESEEISSQFNDIIKDIRRKDDKK